MVDMYADDSFHTLTLIGQVGLVCLSVGLTALILWIAWRGMARLGVLARVGLAAVLFFAFVWLSPQVYYGYYLLVFDGLPLQSVIKAPPGPMRLFDLLTFRGPQTLSAHGQGALGWALFALAMLRPRKKGWRRDPSMR